MKQRKKVIDELRQETKIMDLAHKDEEEPKQKDKNIGEYKTPMRTHMLMIILCLVGIGAGLSLVQAFNSSRFLVDNQTREEVSMAIIDITNKIKSSTDLELATVLENGGIITEDYASTLDDSAFAVLTCSRKIHGEPTFNEIQRFGPNSVKVDLINRADESIKLLMVYEERWKIDSMSCYQDGEEGIFSRFL